MRNHLGAAAPFLSAAFSYHRKTVSLYAVILRKAHSRQKRDRGCCILQHPLSRFYRMCLV